MIIETTTKTVLRRTFRDATKCNVCQCPATHSVVDCCEVPSTDGVYREFEVIQPPKHGCVAHPQTAITFYLDGRVIPSSEAVPEKVNADR